MRTLFRVEKALALHLFIASKSFEEPCVHNKTLDSLGDECKTHSAKLGDMRWRFARLWLPTQVLETRTAGEGSKECSKQVREYRLSIASLPDEENEIFRLYILMISSMNTRTPLMLCMYEQKMALVPPVFNRLCFFSTNDLCVLPRANDFLYRQNGDANAMSDFSKRNEIQMSCPTLK